MSLGSSSTGTLEDLELQEEQKLRQAWMYLLHLCNVETLDENADPSKLSPASVSTIRQHLAKQSPESFRQGLWDFISLEHPDLLVLRFLRAKKWDVEKGVDMLVSAVVWRLEKNIADTIIYTGESVGLKKELSADDEGFMAQYRSGKGYVHATDREGRLVYIIRPRLHNPQAQSSKAMETYVLHNIESLRLLLKPPNDKFCLVFDMRDFGKENMDLPIVKSLVSIFAARYPETLGVILIHNAPFPFWEEWEKVKVLLDPVIASKINYTRKPVDLMAFIPEENLETRYNGTDPWEYKYVEPVAGENAKLEETEKRDEIQREREQLIGEFEAETMKWVSMADDSSAEEEGEESRRDEVADRLIDNYWRLDPYIRATTYYHRVGLVGDVPPDVVPDPK